MKRKATVSGTILTSEGKREVHLDSYYVNNQAKPNGDYDVHIATCKFLLPHHEYVGIFRDCRQAVEAAKNIHPRSCGCFWCCPECYTG